MANVIHLKRKWSPAVDTGTLKCQRQLCATTRAGKRNAHRIHRKLQSPITGLASGLDETGLGHLEKGCGVQQTKSNPAIG